MQTFQEVKEENDSIYYKWSVYNMPEAFDELNDSNRRLIEAYRKEYPLAKGYKAHKGVVDLKESPLYNFCCDILFNASSSVMEALKTEQDEYKRWDIAASADGVYLVWS